MVFATEFDPIEQSQRRQADRIKTNPVQTAVQTGLAGAHSTGPNRLNLNSSGFNASRHPRAVSHDANYDGNVVPLRLGAPAVRVRHERSDDLAIALPSKLKLPLGLQLLNRIQQGSTIVTGFLITGALLVYGSTVYVDKSTSRSVAQLDALQGESQQLTSANEALKQSLAEQATRPDSGLKPYRAGDTLFVAPAPRRESPQTVEPAPEMPVPLGY
jgi:hypothetical protein